MPAFPLTDGETKAQEFRLAPRVGAVRNGCDVQEKRLSPREGKATPQTAQLTHLQDA